MASNPAVKYFVADGFHHDCKAIIDAFCQENSLEFSAFAKVWREMKFELIFSGRPSLAELVEFAEEIIRIAGYHILLSSAELNHRIAAVYLAHSLRLCQPMGKLPNIRVVPSSAPSLKNLYDLLRANLPETTDALYVFCSLLRDGVFRYVVTERDYGFEKNYRKYMDDTSWQCNSEKEAKGLEHLSSMVAPGTGQLQNLASLAKIYHDAKCQLPGNSKDVPPIELNYVDKNFETNLIKSLQELINDKKEKQFEGHKHGVLNRTAQKKSVNESPARLLKRSPVAKKKIKKSMMMDQLEYNSSEEVNGEERSLDDDSDTSGSSACVETAETLQTDMPVIDVINENITQAVDLTD